MRYRRYHVFLDFFGILGIALAITYYYWGHTVSQKNEELFSLWANVSTDIVGIWLGVRIIDYIIRKHEKENAARLFTVRNIRFLTNEMRRAIEFAGRYEVDSLVNEYNWAKGIFEKRRRYFKKDEIKDVEEFYKKISANLSGLEELTKTKEAYYEGTITKAELDKNKESRWSAIATLEEIRLRAEKNILDETEEE